MTDGGRLKLAKLNRFVDAHARFNGYRSMNVCLHAALSRWPEPSEILPACRDHCATAAKSAAVAKCRRYAPKACRLRKRHDTVAIKDLTAGVA